MPGLWVPPSVSRELQESTSAYREELFSRARHREVIDSFNPELKKIDPHLQMVWFDEGTELFGVVPNRYHLLRDNPGAPPSLEPLCDAEGGFIEPNSGVFEWLRKGDMWNAAAKHDRERSIEAARRAAERARDREREDIEEEFKDRYNAAFRTSVSLANTPWTQTARARRPKR
jgi:hypothetical protein